MAACGIGYLCANPVVAPENVNFSFEMPYREATRCLGVLAPQTTVETGEMMQAKRRIVDMAWIE